MAAPPPGLISTVRIIDKFTDTTGTWVAWLNVPLVLVVSYEVFARYVFHAPTIWSFDVTYMLYGTIFMLGSAYVALSSWRGQSGPEPTAAVVDPDSPFTLIEGGRKTKRGTRGAGRSAQQHGSFMERMEERWRRRREQNGGM